MKSVCEYQCLYLLLSYRTNDYIILVFSPFFQFDPALGTIEGVRSSSLNA